MISSVPRNLRAFGQSTAQIFQNLLGYFPAPFLYGYVCRLTGGEKSRSGMIMIFFWSIWGVIALIFAKDAQIKKQKRLREQMIKEKYVEIPEIGNESSLSLDVGNQTELKKNYKIERSAYDDNLIETFISRAKLQRLTTYSNAQNCHNYKDLNDNVGNDYSLHGVNGELQEKLENLKD